MLQTLSGASIPLGRFVCCAGPRVFHKKVFSDGRSVGLPRRVLVSDGPFAQPGVAWCPVGRFGGVVVCVTLLRRAHVVRTLVLRRLRTRRTVSCDEAFPAAPGIPLGTFQTPPSPLEWGRSKPARVRLKPSQVHSGTPQILCGTRDREERKTGNGCDGSGKKGRSRRGGDLRPFPVAPERVP